MEPFSANFSISFTKRFIFFAAVAHYALNHSTGSGTLRAFAMQLILFYWIALVTKIQA